jgi:lipopolysaccharide export LptBFGC system permease protein LptF
MRTVVIIVGGLLLLGVFVLIGRTLGGGTNQSMVTAVKLFLPVWLAAALVNMWIGVSRAGYSVAEELPIFLAIFLIPGLAAAILWWKLSSGSTVA